MMSYYTIQTDNEREHRLHLDGPLLHSILYELEQYLRGKIQGSGDQDAIDVYKKVRAVLHELLRIKGVTFGK